MNELLYKDDDVKICLSLTSMKIIVQNVQELYLLTNKLSGKKELELHTLNVHQKSENYENTPIKKYDYSKNVSNVKQMLQKVINIFMRVTGYVKNAGRLY